MRTTNYVGKLVFKQASDGTGGESTVSVEPLTRDEALDIASVVRCKDCRCFLRDASPYEIDDCPHFCSQHGIDMAEDDGFCSWGRRKDE